MIGYPVAAELLISASAPLDGAAGKLARAAATDAGVSWTNLPALLATAAAVRPAAVVLAM